VEILDSYIELLDVIGKGAFCKVRKVKCDIILQEDPKILGYQNLAVKVYNKG
jgi:hypothetical protein